jgi:dipeptidyl aminopeptidase/acylaminoacyl peptidase
MTEKRFLKLDDLLKIDYLSSPALSPDGREALYCVSKGETETGRFTQKIWRTSTASPDPQPLFAGDFHQKLPRFSPDGSTLYFLSDEGNPDIFQIWSCTCGSRRKLTTLRHGVDWFSVSPDGSMLAFEAPLFLSGTAPGESRENALTEMYPEERLAWKQQKDRQPIVIEELMYKFDETYGIPDGSISQIGTVCPETGELRLLTFEPYQHHCPVFSPDHAHLAFWRFPYDGWKKLRSELTVCDLDGEMEQLTEGISSLGEPPLWLDNHTVLFSAYLIQGEDFHSCWYKVSQAEKKTELYFPESSVSWGPGCLITGHTAYGYPGDNACLIDGRLCYLGTDHGISGVCRMEADASRDEFLTEMNGCIHGFAAVSGSLLYVKGAPEHIANLYFLDLATGEERLLADHNHWTDEVEMPVPTELSIPSPDGTSMIHGWVLKPAGYVEGNRYPAVLDIHGGPECCYPFDWWFEFQYLAARGMAVGWCDPHGSISYGMEYQQGAWDEIAYEDLMAFLDGAIDLGFIDSKRLGVTGGSYGGYMTNHIIGRNSRFAAAVSQRNLCNRATSYGTGDMGSIYGGSFRGCYHSLMERMKGSSTTIKSIDRVDTPLLLLHATNDYRCSFEQAEQFFIAMKDRRPDIPVRLSAFPGENHGLTREGNMYSQRGHLLEMADWFDRYLNQKEED